jgi:ABC-type Mn2+/Zn2+ transport system ATPase subunit
MSALSAQAPGAGAELIRLERAEIGYRAPLLAPLDLTVHRGQRLAVLGPNGGGKSTLLRTLIGLLPPLSGRRVYPSGSKPRIGYVPQTYRADPVYPLSAAEVVLQGRFGRIGLLRFPGRSDRAIALEKLERVGLADKAADPFRALSGGQRQRVLLARALCGEPELLVLDEFTSDLDPAASAQLLAEVSRLASEMAVSVIFVTHEIGAAVGHASEVAMVDARRAVFEFGPAADMLTSERLSRLYGQHVELRRTEGKVSVFVETPSGNGK